MKRKPFRLLANLVLLMAFAPCPGALAGQATGQEPDIAHWFTLKAMVNTRPADLHRTVINGPPEPPADAHRPFAKNPDPDAIRALVTMAVPAYNWSFGSMCTSGAMIAAWYDRVSHPDMYSGPTNGGVMPMDNSVWPAWIDTNGDTRFQCPLSATHNGLDGRSSNGHVDDYWEYYNQVGPDPYDGNWTEHVIGDCTGDYMKTNKWFPAQSFNRDGATALYLYTDGTRTFDTDLETYGVQIYDGGYGLMLFYESRGYTVNTMYNQYIYGYNGNTLGFTWVNYMAEIDAGQPVMLHLGTHTVVGVGYDDTSGQLVYLNDTWDYSTHTMTWGGSYGGFTHSGVTVVELAVPTLVELTSFDAKAAFDHVRLEWATASEMDNAGFHLWRCATKGGEYTRITKELIPARGGVSWGALYEVMDHRVLSGRTYRYKLEDVDFAGNSAFHGPISVRVKPPGTPPQTAP